MRVLVRMFMLLTMAFMLSTSTQVNHPLKVGSRLYYTDRVSSLPDTPNWYMECTRLLNDDVSCNFYQQRLLGDWVSESTAVAVKPEPGKLSSCTDGSDVEPKICWCATCQGVWVVSRELDFVGYLYFLFMNGVHNA